MEGEKIQSYAQELDAARRQGRELPPLVERYGAFSNAAAYAIQAAGIVQREKAGERVIGFKMGLTSEAKRQQMNLHQPIYGVLTDRMQVTDGVFSLAGGIHPKIEPEIAFVMGKDLRGRVSVQEVLNAVSGVCAALEILDSRYKGFKYFSLPDVIADNSSSAFFALGPVFKDFRALDLARLKMVMRVNGEMAGQAESSEISGNPVQSVVQLCELLSAEGRGVQAGQIVLAGAATPAVALQPGMQVELTVENLPDLSLRAA